MAEPKLIKKGEFLNQSKGEKLICDATPAIIGVMANCGLPIRKGQIQLSLCGGAAIDTQACSSDETRASRRQIKYGGSDIFGLHDLL